MNTLHTAVGVGLTALAAATPVIAQSVVDPRASTALEAVVVEAERGAALTVPSQEEARRAARLTPGGATVVDPATYETGRAATPTDLLGLAPGVLIQPRFGSDEARLSIRGSGIQRTFHGRGLLMLVDGMPVNLADGGFDFQSIETAGLKYVEVMRGANALQYGGTTLGGSINFVSMTGHDADRIRLRGEAGSFDYQRLFGATGGVAGAVDYFASLSDSRTDGFRQWSAQENQRFSSNAGLRINPELETRLYLNYTNSDSQLPGSLTQAQLNANPTQANPGNLAGRQKRDYPLWRVSSLTSLALPTGRVDGALFFSHKKLDHPIFQVIRQDSDDYGVSLRYLGEMPVAGRPNRLVAGVTVTAGQTQEDRFVNVRGQAGARTAQNEQRSSNLVLFAEDQYNVVGAWWGVVGLNATWAERKLTDQYFADGQDNSVDQSYRQVSPKLGARLQVAPDIEVFSNLSRSFEPPSFGELAGGPNVTPVRAQTGTTFELGSRGFLPTLQWDVSYYYGRISDELLSLNSPTGQPLGTVNAPRTVHQGIELGLVQSFGPGLELRGSYLWNDFRFDDHPTYGSNRLPGIASSFLRAELLWRHDDGWYLGPTIEWSPRAYPVDMANTLFAAPYTLLGLKAGRRISDGLSFFIEGRNLTDRTYAATTGVVARATPNSAQFLPGDGRGVYAGIDWRL